MVLPRLLLHLTPFSPTGTMKVVLHLGSAIRDILNSMKREKKVKLCIGEKELSFNVDGFIFHSNRVETSSDDVDEIIERLRELKRYVTKDAMFTSNLEGEIMGLRREDLEMLSGYLFMVCDLKDFYDKKVMFEKTVYDKEKVREKYNVTLVIDDIPKVGVKIYAYSENVNKVEKLIDFMTELLQVLKF